jgi:hypothetical protein
VAPACLLRCPEFRPQKINSTTCARKSFTMVIILSARKCCGDRPSSNSESDCAASQDAKAKHAIRRTLGKLSKMYDFALQWRGLVRGGSRQIKQTRAVSCGIRTILRGAQRPLLRPKIPADTAPTLQFVRFSVRPWNRWPGTSGKRTEAAVARAMPPSLCASVGPRSDSVAM